MVKVFISASMSKFIRGFILFTLLLVISCATNPVTGESEFMIVSEQQELTMGKDSTPSLRWEFGGYYRDTELEQYLGNVVKKLWSSSERSHLPVQFHIQNTSIPNAFAIPGYVAITRGLLSEMENEAQFAAVMGHEIGHVMARHSAQRMSRMTLQQIGLGIGAAALGNNGSSEMLLKVGAIGSSLLLLRYDRAQEIQADRLGVKYMSIHGYDPNEALSAHKVLARTVDNYMQRSGKDHREDSFMSSILSTHPRTEVRLSEIQSMIDQLPPYRIKKDGKYADTFINSTKKLRETNKVYFIYDKAEQLYNDKKYAEAEKKLLKAISQNALQSPFHNLLGLVNLRQKEYANAYKLFKKALSINPEYQPAVYGKALVHFYKGNSKQAIVEAGKSLDLYPGHLLSNFVAGKSHYKLRQYSDAIPHLQKFAQAAPRHPEVHGLLGICHDKRYEIRAAVIEYRNQLIVAPDSKLGLHAKKRLLILEPLLKQK